MQPYKIYTHKKDFYQFDTIAGNSYACYFLSYKEYFKDYPSVADKIYSFNVDLVTKSNPKTGKDERIALTIISIVKDFLGKLQSAVVYVCDSSDDKHVLRSRKFNMWFHQYDDGSVIKVDAVLNIEGMELYNSILIHKDNVLKNAFIDAFLDFNRQGEGK